jgi:hypothetical protein
MRLFLAQFPSATDRMSVVHRVQRWLPVGRKRATSLGGQSRPTLVLIVAADLKLKRVAIGFSQVCADPLFRLVFHAV